MMCVLNKKWNAGAVQEYNKGEIKYNCRCEKNEITRDLFMYYIITEIVFIRI